MTIVLVELLGVAVLSLVRTLRLLVLPELINTVLISSNITRNVMTVGIDIFIVTFVPSKDVVVVVETDASKTGDDVAIVIPGSVSEKTKLANYQLKH